MRDEGYVARRRAVKKQPPAGTERALPPPLWDVADCSAAGMGSAPGTKVAVLLHATLSFPLL